MTHDFPESGPGDQGVDARGIAAFVDAFEADHRNDPHSFMLLRHGILIAQGWWAPYTPDRVHLLYSLSKTFTVSALGFAVAEGLVSLDDRVVDHFPEFQAEITGRSRDILVRHVAAMASGHHDDMWDAAETTDPMEPVRGFLLHQPDSPPGSVFSYNQPCTYSIGAIVQRAAGTTLVDYLRPRLFDPLGIGPVSWQELPPGRNLGLSGLHARTDAIAKLGQLYLNDGEWQGRRILPAGWAEQVRTRHVGTPAMTNVDWRQGYGYQVWMARHGYRGDGAYGQYCVILPEHDAVLAITSQSNEMQAVLDSVWEHLLPAFDGKPASAEEEQALADRLRTLSLPALDGGVPEPDWAGMYTAASPVQRRLSGTAELIHDGDGWRVAFDGVVAAFGGDGWIVTERADGRPPVAVSGGIADADTLWLAVLFVETPHRLDLILYRRERRLSVTWVTEPLGMGPPELQAPRPLS